MSRTRSRRIPSDGSGQARYRARPDHGDLLLMSVEVWPERRTPIGPAGQPRSLLRLVPVVGGVKEHVRPRWRVRQAPDHGPVIDQDALPEPVSHQGLVLGDDDPVQP